jgi:hypothetical protein
VGRQPVARLLQGEEGELSQEGTMTDVFKLTTILSSFIHCASATAKKTATSWLLSLALEAEEQLSSWIYCPILHVLLFNFGVLVIWHVNFGEDL